MARKMIDCREFPSEKKCGMVFIGEEEELLDVVTQHAVLVHGHEVSSELRDQIRSTFKDEPASIKSGDQSNESLRAS